MLVPAADLGPAGGVQQQQQQLCPFVRAWRAHAPDARLVLFTDSVAVRDALARNSSSASSGSTRGGQVNDPEDSGSLHVVLTRMQPKKVRGLAADLHGKHKHATTHPFNRTKTL